jgi:3-oxoacyl-[acyl-carrier protein] reductase
MEHPSNDTRLNLARLASHLRVDAGARTPLGRLGRPEEVARATLMVLVNAYMTGQTIQLNGEMSLV